MDCIDCHNRVGHGVPTPDQAIDDSLSSGASTRTCPTSSARPALGWRTTTPPIEDADRAIEGLRDVLPGPLPARGGVAGAAGERRHRRPEADLPPGGDTRDAGHRDDLSRTTWATRSAPGCFRCHDGAHYKVENGAITHESIPSACATCHTFPQIGSTASGVLIGERPATHDDRLWVFSHKSSAGKLDPAGTSCGACHTRTYCENCHQTEAVNVPHDDMVYDHADVMEKTGAQACAYCHQPAYCAQCHSEDVLADAPSSTAHPTLAPPGSGAISP